MWVRGRLVRGAPHGGRRANTASVAIGRQSSRATKKKLPRRRTFCRTKPAQKRPPRDQTDIATGSGHPSEANDSNRDALREHESPLEVGDLKRSKKRLFLRRDAPRGSVLPPRRTDQWVVAPRANDQVHLYHPDSSLAKLSRNAGVCWTDTAVGSTSNWLGRCSRNRPSDCAQVHRSTSPDKTLRQRADRQPDDPSN